MSILIVASTDPRVGRSLIAAAIAYRMGRDGTPVTLARLSGDDGAAADAATFASLEGIVSPGAPVAPEAILSLGSNVVVEASAGSVAALTDALPGARVLVVGLASSPNIDAPKSALAGTIVTRVCAADVATVTGRAGVLAVLPEDRVLAAPSVEDIAAALNGRWLAEGDNRNTIDRVMIGAVASDAASPYFGNRERTCIVTRYDKTDIQLAALQTDIELLVLTGGGEPSPYLTDRVLGSRPDVAVLLASEGTVDAMRAIEGLYGGSRFDGAGKLNRAVALLDEANVPVTLGA